MYDLSLDYFEEHAHRFEHLLDKEMTSVEALIAIYERAVLYGDDHLYTDPYFIVQLASGAQGACFLHLEDWDTSALNDVAGKPALDVLSALPPNFVKVALLDALYYHINFIEGYTPTEEHIFKGVGSQKSQNRAKKIVELANIVKGKKVAIVGLIVDIVQMAQEKGAIVKVADFAEAGTIVSGIPILYDARPLMEWADIAIMTGNTLKTNTIGGLLKLASEHSVKVLIYAMTGHNIAPRYLDYGVDTVTSEGFPYYWYANTESVMRVFR